MEVPGLNPV